MMKNVDVTSTDSFLNEQVDRRTLLKNVGVAGAGLALATLLAGCGGSGSGTATVNMDKQILNAAAVAEALATVMYINIIRGSIYAGLSSNPADQAYLVAAWAQEVNHYNLLVSAGATAVPTGTALYFPTGMFTSAQATFNTLETLEDAFIAAYLIGVRDFSTAPNKVLAAQIMGVEAEHRTLGRVIANDLSLSGTTGLSGTSEGVTPSSHASNNIAYERTFTSALPNIAAVVTALTPFLTLGTAGFSTTPYTFDSTVFALPNGVPAVTLDSTTP